MRGQAVIQSGRSIQRWGWARAALVVCASALLFSACGDDSSTPTSPSPPPAPTTPAPTPPTPTPPATSTIFTVSGTVTDTHTGDAIVGATVTVLDGAHEGRLSTTNDLGAFAIMELEGNLNVAVRAEGYLERRFSVHGVATTLNVDLAPAPSASEPGPAPEPDDDAPEPDDDAPDAPAPPTPNTPATGMPTISGTAQVGETLMANTSAIMDADGMPAPATFTYQWMSDGTSIPGAMAATYEVQATDAGKAITVQVTFTDDAGSVEMLTSAATVTVVSVPGGNTPATGMPMITGTPKVDQTLMANTEAIMDDVDGLTSRMFTYQWMADGMAIMDATMSTYAVTAGDNGKAITVRVTFTDNAGYTEVLTSAPITVSANDPATGSPSIMGFTGGNDTPRVGDELTAVTTAIADVNGVGVFTYEWRTNPGTSNSLVSTMSEYTVRSDDAGKVIVVAVSFTDDGGYAEGPLMSNPTNPVLALVNMPATNFTPTITPVGSLSVGTELTAVPGTPMDVDGVPDPPVFTYQWMTGTGDDAMAIPGATGKTYTITAGEVGEVGDSIMVEVRFTDSRGSMEMATSESDVTYANTPATGMPMITGMPKVGETLTADTSAIEDADGLPTMFTYVWQSNNAAITGATGKTYTVEAGEVSDAITVRVAFTDRGGSSQALTSAPVAYENTPATGVPTITGTPQASETLTADIDNIADGDGLPETFNYQWKAAGMDISGATDAMYTVTDADVGKRISVVVMFTDNGTTPETVTSALTSEVLAALPNNIDATGQPTVAPNTGVMVGSVLTANLGAIADDNGLPETFNYQWLANNEDTGGTGNTYTVRSVDAGKVITVKVTFTDDDGYEEEVTSEGTNVVPNTNFY